MGQSILRFDALYEINADNIFAELIFTLKGSNAWPYVAYFSLNDTFTLRSSITIPMLTASVDDATNSAFQNIS